MNNDVRSSCSARHWARYETQDADDRGRRFNGKEKRALELVDVEEREPCSETRDTRLRRVPDLKNNKTCCSMNEDVSRRRAVPMAPPLQFQRGTYPVPNEPCTQKCASTPRTDPQRPCSGSTHDSPRNRITAVLKTPGLARTTNNLVL